MIRAGALYVRRVTVADNIVSDLHLLDRTVVHSWKVSHVKKLQSTHSDYYELL